MRILRTAGLRLMAALLGLAACSIVPPPPPAHVASAPLKRRGMPHAPRPHASAAKRPPRPAVTAEPPAASIQVAPIQPVRVIGWSPDQVRAHLGLPASAGTHGSVRIWIYRAGGCGLKITFYYDVIRSGIFALSQQAFGPADDKAACAGGSQDTHAS